MEQKLVQYKLGKLISLLFFFLFCLMLWESRWVGGGQWVVTSHTASGLMALISAMTGHLGFQ